MFRCLISKSVILDNIHILIPKNLINNEQLILISHGSSGIGAAEYSTAEFFLSKGYRVGLLDYFSKHNISNLWWNYQERFRDNYNVSFYEMLTDIVFPNEKIVHIGFSLGGFLGILNAEKFYKNFCFYPGIIGYTVSITQSNYNNTTVFNATQDEWCNSYKEFESLCNIPPKRIDIDAYHGFMIPDKDKEIPIAKYKLPNNTMTVIDFCNLKPCHVWLSSKYGYDSKIIRLQHNKEFAIMCLNQIYKEIQ